MLQGHDTPRCASAILDKHQDEANRLGDIGENGAKYLALHMGDLKKYQWGSFRHSHTSAGFGDLMTYKLNVPVAGLTNNAQEFVVHVEYT